MADTTEAKAPDSRSEPGSRSNFDDEPIYLLERSIALALEHIGFTAASKEALESFRAEVDSYAIKFLSYVTESMLSSRRSLPTPLDFEFALRREGLTARLLKPHLKNPIHVSKLQPNFILGSSKERVHLPIGALLGEELSGASDKLAKRYIPKKFPSFPSKHTYKTTAVRSEREADPRRIREMATETARHGEEALRRLVKVGKAGDNRVAKKTLKKNPNLKRRHELWECAMSDLAARKPGGGNVGAEKSIVNALKPYGRREPLRKNQKVLRLLSPTG